MLTNTDAALVEFYIVPLVGRALPVVLVEPPSVRREGPNARLGWQAYTEYALRATRGEAPPTGDPESFAPAGLSGEERRAWCFGWAVHQGALINEVLAAAYDGAR